MGDFGDPRVRQALEQGNFALAAVLAEERLRDACRLSDIEHVQILCQAAFAVLTMRRVGAARQHLQAARSLPCDDDVTAAILAILEVPVAAEEQASTDAVAGALVVVEREIAEHDHAVGDDLRTRLRLAAARCCLFVGDLVSANRHVAWMRANLAARPHWLEAQILLVSATLALLEGSLADVRTSLSLMQPVVAAMGMSTVSAATWWELAEVAHAAGLTDQAWDAATRAIDCSGVRPADGNGTFAPGVLAWAAGV